MKWVLIFTSVFLGALGQICMKWGIEHPRPLFKFLTQALGSYGSWQVLVGLSLYALSAVTWLMALRRVELSIAYPMVATGYVIVVIASYFLFHEAISPQRWLGLGLVTVGVILLGKS